MIDSVLKGTGNSRFLKSAVPAGTSWADALAMLQAGTFPIDFNGINTEGFQQVGTPLNKANLLKDATAAQIGLPPSTTPDGMFQALGNTGELHVWRKTVVSAASGYDLGSVQKNYLASGSVYGSGSSRVTFTVSASVSVADDGTVTQNSPSSETYVYHHDVVSNVQNQIRGKFVSIATDHSSGYYSDAQNGIWFVPADANVTLAENGTSLGYPYNYCYIADKMQKVTGHGKGTTTTYPVSTNPKAYQEGDDAKAAGYVVGETVSGLFRINRVYYSTTIHYANSVNVADDGTVTLAGQSGYGLSAEEDSYNNAKKLAGKFIVADYDHNYCKIPKGVVLFLPTNTTISFRQDVPGDEGYGIFFDRYQPVIGYPAIPAGTTIEYLGKLGDKARVQFGSYVGTGTFGVSNPNTLNLLFTPRFLLVMVGDGRLTYANFALFVYGATYGITVGPSSSNKEIPLTMVWNKNSVSWSCNDSTYGKVGQMNNDGTKYVYVAIG